MTRQLVITADDLGRERPSSLEILDLVQQGAVTASSLITVSDVGPEAARAAAGRGISPHLHLTFTSDEELPSWSPLSTGSTLRDSDGDLPSARELDPGELARREVVVELDAQLAWMHRHGLRPRAADSHAGILYGLRGPSFLAEAITWSAVHGLAFRLPREPGPLLGAMLPSQLLAQLESLVAYADALDVPLPQTIITNPSAAAQLGRYEALRAQLIALVSQLPEGTSELFLHPAREGAGIPLERLWEARLLRDDVWHDALDSEDITLVSRWWG